MNTLGEVRTICRQCGSPDPYRSAPGADPQHQRLPCGAFLRWLPKPRPVAPEVCHA